MMKIFKYPIEMQPEGFTRDLPWGANIMHVNLDPNGTPCFWAGFSCGQRDIRKRSFVVVGTGEEVDPARKVYVGSWKQDSFMWHLFEVT